MFNLLQSASDDQTAIVACLLTIVGATFLVIGSYHLGPAGQKERNRLRNRGAVRFPSATEVEPTQSQDRAA